MLYGARIALLLLSALSAHLVPACGRSYGRDRDVARTASAAEHASSFLAALRHNPPAATQASASCLSTTAGSSRIARTAGPRAAASATVAMSPATRTIVDQSVGSIPYN